MVILHDTGEGARCKRKDLFSLVLLLPKRSSSLRCFAGEVCAVVIAGGVCIVQFELAILRGDGIKGHCQMPRYCRLCLQSCLVQSRVTNNA